MDIIFRAHAQPIPFVRSFGIVLSNSMWTKTVALGNVYHVSIRYQYVIPRSIKCMAVFRFYLSSHIRAREYGTSSNADANSTSCKLLSFHGLNVFDMCPAVNVFTFPSTPLVHPVYLMIMLITFDSVMDLLAFVANSNI